MQHVAITEFNICRSFVFGLVYCEEKSTRKHHKSVYIDNLQCLMFTNWFTSTHFTRIIVRIKFNIVNYDHDRRRHIAKTPPKVVQGQDKERRY